mmetsp:Transcript_29763/g.46020  ORF Transcript_29763/g.46020 Transcript_29763/m.46020 type:complete len:240 (-) Transcript_29763:11-730(-)
MSLPHDEQKESDMMRELWNNSLRLSPPGHLTNSDYMRHSMRVNPLLIDYPRKCVHIAKSDEEASHLLRKYSSGSDVAIVQYTQSNCTSCNALSKISEFLCHNMSKTYPKLRFIEVNSTSAPQMTAEMARFPLLKGYSQGWSLDMDFKPPPDFRDEAQKKIQRKILSDSDGKLVNALQAEEMYYSVSAPAITVILEESISSFYTKSQADLHNYWGQVSRRRSWFYKKYIAPESREGRALQ